MIPILFLLQIISLSGCGQGVPPEKELPPEEKATEAFKKLSEEFEAERKAIGDSYRIGEATEDDFIDLDRRYRIKLDQFVKDHKGTEAASGVELGFIQQEMDEGEYESARGRLNRLVDEMSDGESLALVLIYLSILEADTDIEKALEYVVRVSKMNRVSEATLIEAGIQRLKLLEWLKRDDEFDALYIQLSGKVEGYYAGPLGLIRLNYFLRHGKMDAVDGLIDSLSKSISRDTLTMLKAEVATQALLGRTTPSIEGQDLWGNYFGPDYFEGKNLLLVFFSSSNPVMRRFIPMFNNLQSEYSPLGLEVVGISLDPVDGEMNSFASEMEINFLVLMDAEMKLQSTFFAARDPKTYLIDSSGILVSHGLEGVLLEERIRELLVKEI